MTRAVITGVGAIGAWGSGTDELERALAEGRPAMREVDVSAGHHRKRTRTLRAGLVADDAVAPWVAPMERRRMSRPSRMAVAAARQAVEAAGLERAEIAGDDTAVALATTFGSTSFTERMLEQVFDTGPESASPFLFMETVASAHAGQVALLMGARGANVTITQREAGSLLAVAHGAEELERGAARHVLAGTADEMAPLAHALLERFDALASDTTGPRPMDEARDGFLAAEGAALLLLEREDEARARGATILARVRARIRAFDPSASRSGWGDGDEHLARALRRGLTRAHIDPTSIDRIIAGASGSAAGDLLEARVLARVFEDRVPPVLTPKGVVGEYGGGALAAAVVLARAESAPAPAGFEHADPKLGLTPFGGGPLPPAKRTLVSALAAGGAAAWLVLETAP